MRLGIFMVAAACAGLLRAEESVQRMLTRLAEEASAFERVAPNVLAQETLRQRAMKPTKRQRFRPRVVRPGDLGPQWQTREIISEYGYSTLGDEPGGIREFRRVVSVDGKPIESSEKALEALAKGIQSQDGRVKRKMLEDFEKHGLIGTVTDFGPLILLFDRQSLERYEFRSEGTRIIGADQCLVFAYAQTDGPESLTIWEGKRRVRQRLSGEIVVRASDSLPVRITVVSVRGEGESAVRDEGEVDYQMSAHGALLPIAVVHREFREGRGLIAENRLEYGPFHRFGASTEIKFDVVPEPRKPAGTRP